MIAPKKTIRSSNSPMFLNTKHYGNGYHCCVASTTYRGFRNTSIMLLIDGDHKTGGYNEPKKKNITSALTWTPACALYILQTPYTMCAESADRPRDIEASGSRDLQFSGGASQFSESFSRSSANVKSARYLFLGCQVESLSKLIIAGSEMPGTNFLRLE